MKSNSRIRRIPLSFVAHNDDQTARSLWAQDPTPGVANGRTRARAYRALVARDDCAALLLPEIVLALAPGPMDDTKRGFLVDLATTAASRNVSAVIQ